MRFIKISLFVVLIFIHAQSLWAVERRTPVVKAVEAARQAVVNIRTEQIVRRSSTPFGFGDSFFEQFFQDLLPPFSRTSQSLGSGVIIDRDGYILTNAHVIAKASRIFVALPDRDEELEARLVGADQRLDLAVLKMNVKGDWPYLPPASSEDLMLGETVIAIGNPLGLGHSITTGIVSSAARRIALEEGFSSVFIQSDALINPGNSGGPLININGELIGINTAIAKQAQGIGFSIPIDRAKRVLAELIEFGKVRSVSLGLLPGEVGKSFSRKTGQRGVLVVDFFADSPAREAGLELADVIQAVNRQPVHTVADLNAQLATYPPDSRVQLEVLRGSQKRKLSVDLVPLSDEYLMAYTRKVFGLMFTEGRGGLRVTQVVPDSAAERAGLVTGDIVAEIARRKVAKIDDLRRLAAILIGREPFSFLIVRNNRGYLLQLPQD